MQRQEANSVPTNEDVIPLMQRAPSDLLQTCDSELDGFYDDDLLPNPVSMPGETSDTSGNNEVNHDMNYELSNPVQSVLLELPLYYVLYYSRCSFPVVVVVAII